jgi:hypothetical protein
MRTVVLRTEGRRLPRNQVPRRRQGVLPFTQRQRLFVAARASRTSRLPAETAIDRELIALCTEGRPSFDLLQHGPGKAK